MIEPKIPQNEEGRIANLKSYQILDTLPENEYDEITFLASQICGTPISLISLIDETRQWFKSHHGLEASETPKEYAFCAHAINDPENILIVPDSRIDERFHDNPLVIGDPHVIFYVGVPLVSPLGFPLGTLCVIDSKPKELNEIQLKALKALANQLIKLLDLRISHIELLKSEQNLKELNATKDRLFSIIGHDLRGPICNFKLAIDLLVDDFDFSDKSALMKILKSVQKSTVSTFDLLEGLLMWAKSQQNEIIFSPKKIALDEIVVKTIDLLSDLCINKEIVVINNVIERTLVYADENMLTIVLRNLISNAIKFTPKGKQIQVSVNKTQTEHIITVKDEGVGIKPENMQKLFKNTENITTFGTNGEKGTGLGLLLCKDFIMKHNGTIWAESDLGKGSAFMFSLPLVSPHATE
jgi:signal transduction histidine kinase